MPIKFLIGDNIKDPQELDIPRGLEHPSTGDVVLIKKGKKFSKDRPIFEYTRNELKKDQQWTRQKKKP